MTKATDQSIKRGHGSSLVTPHILEQKELLSLKPKWLVCWAATAVALFQLAYGFSQLSLLILAYPICLVHYKSHTA